MTAPMRSVPAMPPVTPFQRRIAVAFATSDVTSPYYAASHPRFYTKACTAFCYAQAAADRDGKRRRVFKDGDVWRVAVVR